MSSNPLATTDAHVPLPGLLERADCIRTFGATYLHGGGHREPIREILGRHPRDPDPVRGHRCFASRELAVAHVRSLARQDAEAELARIDAFSPTTRERTRLWLARNWPSYRRHEVGTLASEAILAARRREHRDIVRNGYEPRVVELPDGLRFPRLVEVGSQVWVLDLSRFPHERVSLKLDEVVGRSVLNLQDHPLFDALVRYELGDTPGLFGLDSADPATARLSGPDDVVKVFLSEAEGVREIARMAATLTGAFGVEVPLDVPLLRAPPVPRALPDPRVPHVAEAPPPAAPHPEPVRLLAGPPPVMLPADLAPGAAPPVLLDLSPIVGPVAAPPPVVVLSDSTIGRPPAPLEHGTDPTPYPDEGPSPADVQPTEPPEGCPSGPPSEHAAHDHDIAPLIDPAAIAALHVAMAATAAELRALDPSAAPSTVTDVSAAADPPAVPSGPSEAPVIGIGTASCPGTSSDPDAAPVNHVSSADPTSPELGCDPSSVHDPRHASDDGETTVLNAVHDPVTWDVDDAPIDDVAGSVPDILPDVPDASRDDPDVTAMVQPPIQPQPDVLEDCALASPEPSAPTRGEASGPEADAASPDAEGNQVREPGLTASDLADEDGEEDEDRGMHVMIFRQAARLRPDVDVRDAIGHPGSGHDGSGDGMAPVHHSDVGALAIERALFGLGPDIHASALHAPDSGWETGLHVPDPAHGVSPPSGGVPEDALVESSIAADGHGLAPDEDMEGHVGDSRSVTLPDAAGSSRHLHEDPATHAVPASATGSLDVAGATGEDHGDDHVPHSLDDVTTYGTIEAPVGTDVADDEAKERQDSDDDDRPHAFEGPLATSPPVTGAVVGDASDVTSTGRALVTSESNVVFVPEHLCLTLPSNGLIHTEQFFEARVRLFRPSTVDQTLSLSVRVAAWLDRGASTGDAGEADAS